MPLALMASDSRKERVLKHQQVPLRYWFLMGVMGSCLTVVNRFYGGGRPLGAGAQDGQGGEGCGNNVLFHAQINLITYKIKDYILILQP